MSNDVREKHVGRLSEDFLCATSRVADGRKRKSYLFCNSGLFVPSREIALLVIHPGEHLPRHGPHRGQSGKHHGHQHPSLALKPLFTSHFMVPSAIPSRSVRTIIWITADSLQVPVTFSNNRACCRTQLRSSPGRRRTMSEYSLISDIPANRY